MRKNIVIDTNILYAWADISDNGKIASTQIEELSKTHDLSITSTSLWELIAKYRNDLDTIRKCLHFIYENKLAVIQIIYTPITREQIDIIYYDQNQESSIIIDEIYNLKIRREAEFLNFFLVSLLSGVINLLIEECTPKLTDKLLQMIILHSTSMLEGNLTYLSDVIENSLKDGYDRDDQERAIKSIFSDTFVLFINLWKRNYYTILNGYRIDEVLSAKKNVLEKIQNEVASDNLLIQLHKHMDNPLLIFAKGKYRKAVLDYHSKLKLNLSTELKLTPEVLNYILYKFDKYFDKSKIDKNDVLDLVITYALFLKDEIILTLDKKMINFLKEHHINSYNFIQNFIIAGNQQSI